MLETKWKYKTHTHIHIEIIFSLLDGMELLRGEFISILCVCDSLIHVICSVRMHTGKRDNIKNLYEWGRTRTFIWLYYRLSTLYSQPLACLVFINIIQNPSPFFLPKHSFFPLAHRVGDESHGGHLNCISVWTQISD